jgi:hypothetical protein
VLLYGCVRASSKSSQIVKLDVLVRVAIHTAYGSSMGASRIAVQQGRKRGSKDYNFRKTKEQIAKILGVLRT